MLYWVWLMLYSGEELEALMKETILLVDDDEVVLELEQMILSGFKTLLASNGEEAFKLLANHPDVFLIISDLKMPKMNGLELLKAVKKDFPAIQFFILTGGAEEELVSSLFRYGLDGYLNKPFHSEQILEIVNSARKNQKKVSEFNPAVFDKI